MNMKAEGKQEQMCPLSGDNKLDVFIIRGLDDGEITATKTSSKCHPDLMSMTNSAGV